MRDIRQGNDVAVIWSLMSDGKPFQLQGRALKLYLKNMYGSKEVTDFSVKGNQIHWTFFGKDQKSTGRYSLTLVVNENEVGIITTDTCDFVRLVSHSCAVCCDSDSPNVETETIELTSTLDYVANVEQGGSYDDTALWQELGKKVDKVEGKGLSSNDYTNEDKEKLASLKDFDDSALRTEIGKKVDATFVNEAIANAITNALNTEV